MHLDHILYGNNKVLNVIEYSAKCTTNFTKLAYKLICHCKGTNWSSAQEWPRLRLNKPTTIDLLENELDIYRLTS